MNEESAAFEGEIFRMLAVTACSSLLPTPCVSIATLEKIFCANASTTK